MLRERGARVMHVPPFTEIFLLGENWLYIYLIFFQKNGYISFVAQSRPRSKIVLFAVEIKRNSSK